MEPESLPNEPPEEPASRQKENPLDMSESDDSRDESRSFLKNHATTEASSTRNDSQAVVQDVEDAFIRRHGPLGIRLAAILIALLPITLLCVAGNLNPDQRGLGTHQQLGLPPCSLRFLVGIRCPACGMTTSWSYFARGNWIASARTNLGGFLLAIFSLSVVWMATQVIRTGTPPSASTQRWLTYAMVGILIVTALDWVVRLQT